MNPIIKTLFEDENLWKEIYPNYKIRAGQIKLADEIYKTIKNQAFLIAEAGTGTGKTLAYLLPSLLYALEEKDYKILISTETKALQNQILSKDIPLLEKLLKIKIPTEICLGSNNYVCKRRLYNFANSQELPPQYISILEKFLKWEKESSNGIIYNYPNELPKDFINEVVRNPNLCLANNCPNFEKSFYFLEKEKWKKAKILIVNHHLLSAHIESNFSLLPKFHIAIIDEAHSFPSIYRDSNVQNLSFRELHHFIKKFKLEGILLDSLKQFQEDIQNQIIKDQKEDKFRLEKSLEINSLYQFINAIEKAKQKLEDQLKQEQDLFSNADFSEKSEKEVEFINAIETLNQVINLLDIFYEGPIYNRVHFIEYNTVDLKLCVSYVDVGEFIYEKFLKKIDSCIFTSATLAINSNFDFFINKIGLIKFKDNQEYLKTLVVPSPFNYKEQALLYIPKHLEDPSDLEFLNQSIKEIYQLIDLVNGNTLVIFTSKSNLNYVYKQIIANYGEELNHKKIQIYSQEVLGAQQSLQRYLNDERGVLFGLESFRQGIDLAGDKLKCVILVKLPFSVPTDPVQQAQIELEKEKERNPFLTIQIPEMIIKLKQGMGRLIRTETDKGIIAILDPRIYTKKYGELILKSLGEYKLIKTYAELKNSYNHLYSTKEKIIT
jgi:ATP-dependent DNA helicase DinG